MIDDGKNLEPPAEPFHRVQQPAVFAVRNAGGCRWTSPCFRPFRCAVRYVPFRLSLQGSGSCARTGWSIRPYGGCGRTSRNPGCSRRRSPGRFLPNIPARHTGPPGPPPCGISSALYGMHPASEPGGHPVAGTPAVKREQDRIIRQDGDRPPQPSFFRSFPRSPDTSV